MRVISRIIGNQNIVKKSMARNVMILCFLVAIFALVLTNRYLWCLSDNNSIHFRDITGDRAYLKEIVIKGRISDHFQKTDFVIRNEKVHTKLKSSQFDRDSVTIPRASITRTNQDGLQFFYENQAGKELLFYIHSPNGVDTNKISTVVEDHSTGKHYAYTLTNDKFTGTGGAYEVTDQEQENKMQMDPNRMKNIAPIRIKHGDIQIIGMEATEQVLLFVTIQHKDIVLMPFDLVTKTFLSEIDLQCGNSEYDYSVYYSSQVDGQFISLNIPMDAVHEFNREDIYKTVVYNAKTNQLVMNCSEPECKGGSENKMFMRYKDNKLYLMQVVSDFDNTNYLSHREERQQFVDYTEKLLITVLNDNHIAYQGEIVTYANDDKLYQGKQINIQEGLQKRVYSNLSLQ